MNVSCPALAFACALVLAASALPASVITPPVHPFPAHVNIPDVVVTRVFATTCEAPPAPVCGITDSTANTHRSTDLPRRDLLVEMAGADVSDGDSSWVQFLPVVIEDSAPRAMEISMFTGPWTF